VILAIAVKGLLAFGATTASAAANFKSQSFSVNNQGQHLNGGLPVHQQRRQESGCRQQAHLDRGNRHRSDDPRAQRAYAGDITVKPAGPGTFTCPSGQALFLVSACYTDISLDRRWWNGHRGRAGL
jgi:hypothetical protein